MIILVVVTFVQKLYKGLQHGYLTIISCWKYVCKYFSLTTWEVFPLFFNRQILCLGNCFFVRNNINIEVRHCWLKLMSWWRHHMETFSALLALCAGNSPITRWIPRTKASDAELWCLFVFICACVNDSVYNREAGYMRHRRDHYDVRIMHYSVEGSHGITSLCQGQDNSEMHVTHTHLFYIMTLYISVLHMCGYLGLHKWAGLHRTNLWVSESETVTKRSKSNDQKSHSCGGKSCGYYLSSTPPPNHPTNFTNPFMSCNDSIQ